MSVTQYALGDPLAVKLWAKKLSVEANKAYDVAPLFGEGTDSVIQIKTETQKGTGDKVTFGLRRQLAGAGFTSSDIAEGNGEQLGTNSDAVTIEELGHVVGVASKDTIDAQRVPFDLRDEARAGLADWFRMRMAVSVFNHLCGFTPANAQGAKYTANNPVTAATRVIRPNGKTSDANLANTDIMTLAQIDAAVEIAKTGGAAGDIMMRPVDTEYGKMFVLYLHSTQVTSLRTNTASGQWLDIQKAAFAAMSGDGKKNPIFTGALGIYNNVVLRESQQITQGVSATNTAVPSTRRAVLMGAQAMTCAFGKRGGVSAYRWNEELYDHKRKLEVSAWKLWGLKKTTFNGRDFSVITIPTWAQDAG